MTEQEQPMEDRATDLYDQDITARQIPGADSPDQLHFRGMGGTGISVPKLSTEQPIERNEVKETEPKTRLLQAIESGEELEFVVNTKEGEKTTSISGVQTKELFVQALRGEHNLSFTVKAKDEHIYAAKVGDIKKVIENNQ